MSAPAPNRLVAWLKELERRGDAWAAKRLSPEEFADATALDQQLKQHWPRWLGWYALICGGLTLGLMLLKPSKLEWGHAFLFANLLAFCALVFFLSAWYGYRKWTGPRARRHYVVFIATLLIGAAGAISVELIAPGRTISEFAPARVSTTLGAVLLMAMVAFALLISIATLRNREVAQRMALLQADAERERLERQGVQAELKLLQAQVEPHFLFNTLANVRHLVQTGSPDALAMLDHLIHYLRTSLPEIRSESSTLGREAELARAYLEILRLRMGGALEIAIDVPAELARAPFPPLMVMTLVENAIKHGVAPHGRGHVSVSASAAEGRLRVVVEDDGRGLAGTLGRGVGLANVRERLAAIFGAGARLDLEGRADGGTRATIEVPDR
jgi:signal transduction histidine kinase